MTLRKDTSRTRTPLAIALIIASFLSAFFLASFSQRGSEYWVAVVDMVPGHLIDTGDLVLRHLDLDSSAALYLARSDDPLGLVVTNMLTPGQILESKSVSSRRDGGAASAVPLSIRGADIDIEGAGDRLVSAIRDTDNRGEVACNRWCSTQNTA